MFMSWMSIACGLKVFNLNVAVYILNIRTLKIT